MFMLPNIPSRVNKLYTLPLPMFLDGSCIYFVCICIVIVHNIVCNLSSSKYTTWCDVSENIPVLVTWHKYSLLTYSENVLHRTCHPENVPYLLVVDAVVLSLSAVSQPSPPVPASRVRSVVVFAAPRPAEVKACTWGRSALEIGGFHGINMLDTIRLDKDAYDMMFGCV